MLVCALYSLYSKYTILPLLFYFYLMWKYNVKYNVTLPLGLGRIHLHLTYMFEKFTIQKAKRFEYNLTDIFLSLLNWWSKSHLRETKAVRQQQSCKLNGGTDWTEGPVAMSRRSSLSSKYQENRGKVYIGSVIILNFEFF